MKKKIVTALLTMIVIAGLFLAGCSTIPTPNPQPGPGPDNTSEPGPNPQPGTAGEDVVEANNAFAMDLYHRYKEEEGNVFLSPYSVSSALTMTYEGARGETAEEMRTVLHLPADKEDVREGYKGMNSLLNQEGKEYQLSVANALWAQEGYPFLDDYFSAVEEYYGGSATNLDFAAEPEESRVTINEWVEEETNDRIQDLIPQGVIDSLTRLVLTNTIYFKANWTSKFDPSSTRDQEFTLSSGEVVTAEMMHQTTYYQYTEDDDVQVLELDYKGEDLSMLVILPKENDLVGVEGLLNTEKLAGWREGLGRERVRLTLPKFTFETKYFMVRDLEKMGMSTAFSGGADFTGMSPTGGLCISEVIHQTFIEVAENGTEAAAATAVIMKDISPGPGLELEEPKVFTADHPFLFLIQEKETGNILFLGRLSDPTKE
ncbi:serpin family protein [Candidatus Woesearchaeota archaeon]|nr:serpin family protein [Candidatus Woesearchaeota archaeon]